ncbi:serine hydrolase [Candidatus Uhrbacteria bacterium]|nr:serine hydrolase [Candidatus Uhrbacteria bacterium]
MKKPFSSSLIIGSLFLNLAAMFLSLGLFVALVFFKPQDSGIKLFRQIRENSDKHQLINPLLACEVSEKKDVSEFTPLKNEINQVIYNGINSKAVTTASIYFDTRDGRWLGINTQEKFYPASLMKVPTMIAFYKAAETKPKILNQKVFYNGTYNLNLGQFYQPAKKLTSGTEYTVDELIRRMVAYSDNNALPLLQKNIDDSELREVLTDLGISLPSGELQADFMTVKSYASFFRVLFNATYLSRDMSEKALEILTEPDFPGGIVSSVPSNISVAQKFGETTFGSDFHDPAAKKELHDCGIIYYPDHPYLMCIMTKGNDFNKMAEVIHNIANAAFDHINKEYKKY